MNIKVSDTISLVLIDESHAVPIYNLVDRNRKQLGEWLPWVDHMDSVDFIRSFIADQKKRIAANTDQAFVIFAKDELVGRLGFYQIDAKNHIASIGYWLGEPFVGQGIVTQSCKALIDYGFHTAGFNRIEIRCGVENRRSQAIPERLGFKKEGLLRQAEKLNERYIDLYLYALLRSEWQEDQTPQS